ncbi:NAD+ synthase [Thiomicrorhabdus sp. 6S2-11]|uniref:Glutamine-dependent NAD(+) synthetase n=1 Tax=Thiomicrorhabdus marina TaxID=2818442 RepID=A0ABS3Q1I3_9GAMM|nr:NAD+ synthase [Thiomicrorhabdus marina]MBO1925988.1 NAD+ synthase [Thiomicrorhabdus marina]
MTDTVKLIMAQINPKVGDIQGNVDLILETLEQAKQKEAELVVFPEMTITGYPPEDLLLRDGLYSQVEAALLKIVNASQDIACVIGYPMMDELGERFNMAAFIADGELLASYVKQNLPNYSVFDEQRYFNSGKQDCVVNYKGIKFGILICEDIWKISPAAQAKQAGAEVLLTLNASPFSQEKHQDRLDTLAHRVNETGLPIVYVNQVGGQDELVFDGGSFAVSADNDVCVQAPEFVENLCEVNFIKQQDSVVMVPGEKAELFAEEARIYQALITGVRDYVGKNGFPGVLLGLSGGIDSALTLAVAVDALGAENVEAVMMPFRYTAQISQDDAAEQANIMGVNYQSIPIEPMYQAFEMSLQATLAVGEPDITEENLQARIRGTLLMAMSNKNGKMVLATSNKSEVAVGYSTLYGDMVGGFSPLKDVPKTMVYQLAKYRNSISQVIPERVITRPPSAELRPDQKDQDSLPDYDSLDAMIKAYVKQDMSPQQIVEMGYEESEVRRVIRLIDRSEYKRRQSAPGVKITHRAFGRDRRYPITSGYKE